MHYGQIYYADIANGEGMRTDLFVSGCTHHCKNCFNEVTWDFNYGELYTEDVENRIIESLRPSYIAGLTILGGEPMEVANQPTVRALVERVRREVPHSKTWIYSGYTWEELMDPDNKRCHSENTLPILQNIDILVDGRFVEELGNLRLNYRGSSNQRIIMVPESLQKGEIVLSPLNNEV